MWKIVLYRVIIMKTYKTETVVRETIDKIFCDICGEDMLAEFNKSGHLYDDCVISHKYAHDYSYDHADHNEFEPDICPKCFQSKIIPFLKSIGLNTEYKYEYR